MTPDDFESKLESIRAMALETGALRHSRTLNERGLPLLVPREDGSQILSLLLSAGYVFSNDAELGCIRVHRLAPGEGGNA